MKLFCALQYLFVQSTLQLIELVNLLLIDCNHCLHPFNSTLVFDVIFGDFLTKLRYFIVLKLYISRLMCILPLEEEVMIFQLFYYVSLHTFDLIDFDCILRLFLIERLKQFTHNFSNFRFHFIPFKLSYLHAVFINLLLFTSHYFIIIKKSYIRLDNKRIIWFVSFAISRCSLLSQLLLSLCFLIDFFFCHSNFKSAMFVI